MLFLKPKATAKTKVSSEPIDYGIVKFTEEGEEHKVLEMNLRMIRMPNPGENIIAGQYFQVLLRFGEDDLSAEFHAKCHAISAGPNQVIGKFQGMTDDEKRLIAAFLRRVKPA